jgi:CheY-like chemotaxis protein
MAMKIMVVDDEEDVQILFKQRFRKEIRSGTIEFKFAFSGESALDYLKKEGDSNISQIFSDINMPGMNGIELLKRIKEQYNDLKVSMITAYADDHNFHEAKEYGCDDYFTKPIDFTDLKQKIFATS